MKNHLNSKKQNTFMKRISMIFLVFILCFTGINAVSMTFDQSQTINSYELADKGLSNTRIIDGSSNSETIALYPNGTKTVDIIFDIRSLDRTSYLIIDNYIVNTTMNISYFNNDNTGIVGQTDNQVTTRELILHEQGIYYFEINPTYTNENVIIGIDAQQSYLGRTFIQDTRPKGLNYVFETFIGGINTLIDIIISLWKLFYYVIIIGFIIGALISIVAFGFKFIEFAEKVKAKKKDLMKGGK